MVITLLSHHLLACALAYCGECQSLLCWVVLESACGVLLAPSLCWAGTLRPPSLDTCHGYRGSACSKLSIAGVVKNLWQVRDTRWLLDVLLLPCAEPVFVSFP